MEVAGSTTRQNENEDMILRYFDVLVVSGTSICLTSESRCTTEANANAPDRPSAVDVHNNGRDKPFRARTACEKNVLVEDGAAVLCSELENALDATR